MAADANEMQGEPSADRPAKNAGRLRLVTLQHLDGRTRAAQLVENLRDKLLAERGGRDRLDVRRIKHAETWALLTVMIEHEAARYLMGEAIEPQVIGTLVNARKREGEIIGEPEPRDVTPMDYLRSLEAEPNPKAGVPTPKSVSEGDDTPDPHTGDSP